MLKKTLILTIAALGLLMTTAPAWADGVSIVNASFEDLSPVPKINCPSMANCYYNNGPIPGWTGTQQTGSFQPGGYFSAIPDGSIVAFTNHGDISQTLSSSVLADTLYTLTVFVGNRTDNINGLYTLNLDTILNGVTTNLCSVSGNAASITSGTFQAESCKYQSTSIVPVGDLFLDFASISGQLDVDDVSLTTSNPTTGVPEPGSVLFLGLGMLLVLSVGIWNRKKGVPVSA